MVGDDGSASEDVRGLARLLLVDLPDRWAHTQGVANAAEIAALGLTWEDAQAVVAAAWLHDIGYAARCRRTGFHSIDGARELLDRGYDPRVAALVAHHTMARHEALARGMSDELDTYPLDTGPVADTLTWADMTTDPTGGPTSAEDRLAEILGRYPSADPVHVAIRTAREDILAAVRRTEERIAARVH